MSETLTPRQKWYREEYLQSQHWTETRQRKLELYPACEICNSTKYLQVHHKRYNLWHEKMSELQVLCNECHSNEHKRYRTWEEIIAEVAKWGLAH